MNTWHVTLTFTDPLLGTASADPEIYRRFIQSKAPDPPDGGDVEDEAAALPDPREEYERTVTVFPRADDGRPFLHDYQIKGFFKDAASMLGRTRTEPSADLRAFKKVIDGLVFVTPRRLPLALPEGGEVQILERPLRASTAQGERVALAASESVPPGTTLAFDLTWFDLKKPKNGSAIDLGELLEDWLQYGRLRGLGQWRNSGKGRFAYAIKTGSESASA